MASCNNVEPSCRPVTRLLARCSRPTVVLVSRSSYWSHGMVIPRIERQTMPLEVVSDAIHGAMDVPGSSPPHEHEQYHELGFYPMLKLS